MKPMTTRPLIAIITDFGLDDPFVGIMKGVISGISPLAQVIDINHSIPQGDIQRAAIQLWMSKSYFPPGTIFLVVVDPGVGTPREAIIVDDGEFIYIGPNNGIFSFAVNQDAPGWELTNIGYQLANRSSTFHGRDIFAPAAAHTAEGVPAGDFGRHIKGILQLPVPRLVVEAEQISGEIIYSDQFGNLLTSLGEFVKSGEMHFRFEPWLPVSIANKPQELIQFDKSALLLPSGQKISPSETFAGISPGECGFIVGSTGLIEIAAQNSSAQAITNLALGDPITLLL